LHVEDQDNPVLAAWTSVRDRYLVPQQYVEELVDGCETDLTVSRYESWDQLARYCYCVASTVGLISMHVIGVVGDDPALFERSRLHAVNLGIALQLTNILRDIGEDLGRGRIYLPQEDMRRFGYTESELRAGIVNDRFRDLMRFEIARANALYDASLPAIANLKADGRTAVGAAALLYRGILDRIIDNDFDVFRRRACLSLQDKVGRMPGIMMRIRRLRSES
jgi:phytoene synthase